MKTINIRLDERIKLQAQKVAEGLGLDLSSCIRMFLVQMANQQTLPITHLTVNGFTPKQEQAILDAYHDTSGDVVMTDDEFSRWIDDLQSISEKAVQKRRRKNGASRL